MKHLKILVLLFTLSAVTGRLLPADIHDAVKANDLDALETLLDRGKDPNAEDEYGNRPLHFAKFLTIHTLLEAKGIDVNAKNQAGVTPLHVMVVKGKPILVKLLLDAKADVNLADNNGITALHLATAISYFKDESALKGQLFASKEEQSAASSSVTGPALFVGFLSLLTDDLTTGLATIAIMASAVVAADIPIRNRVLGLLLKAGAKVNAKDNAGNTPLHILASGRLLKPGDRRGGILMAVRLIHNKADITIKNNKKQTPYNVAEDYKRLLLMPVLSSMGMRKKRRTERRGEREQQRGVRKKRREQRRKELFG